MRKKLAEKYAKKLNKLVEEFNISYNVNNGGSGMVAIQIHWFLKSLGFDVKIKKYEARYSVIVEGEFEINNDNGPFEYVDLYNIDDSLIYWAPAHDQDSEQYDHKNDLDFIKALNKLKL